MTIDEALEFADEWSRGVTIYPGAQGWRVVCMLLADEVRRLREERNPLAERVTELEQQGPRRGVQGIGRGMTYDEWLAQQENACDAVMYGRKVWEGAWSEIEQQLAAKDDEIRELVTSDNKVVADLSRYVETLEQKIADKNDAYRAACAVVAKMHEAAIGEVVGPVLGVVEVVANVREQLIEAQKQIVMLREELATTQSELETERRLSFRNQVAELERELFAMNGEITALKIQLLNRNVSNLEASANFAMTDMQQQQATPPASSSPCA